jgi:hypothetical protein
MKTRKARVLLIDDKSEWPDALSLILNQNGLSAIWRTPQDLDVDELYAADLVLVDLDLGDFDVKTFPSLESPDGLALASLLRRQKMLIDPNAKPIGFALVSGKVDELAAPFPSTKRIPLLSKQHNLEWIFRKENAVECARAVASLACAVRDIPKNWEDGIQTFKDFSKPFGIAGAKDVETCWIEIEKCHPPIYEITRWTHGLALVRWMQHTILYYPCFLWDENYLAARLRISHASFDAAHKESKRFRNLLAPAKYEGFLSDFAGTRWWRHRIEALAWELTKGDSQNSEVLRRSLSKKTGFKFEASPAMVPFVCRDKDYSYVTEPVALEQAVRVQPDDWPPYADVAWMRIEDVAGNAELRALVVQDDRARLPKFEA